MTARQPLSVVVLISGQGTNLQALIHAQSAGPLASDIRAVVSDRSDAPGLERARRAGIDALYLNPADFNDDAAFDVALAQEVLAYEPELVVLAGLMRILSPSFVTTFAGRMLNIHPSLLPRFRGLDTHQRVLDSGDRRHGATVHYVTSELDGGPRVIQYRLAVRPDDDVASLKARVARGEHVILPQAVGWIAERRLRLADGVVMLDDRRLNRPIVVEGDE